MFPKVIKTSCIVGSIAFILHAALAPFYETGADRFGIPVIFIGIVLLLLSFIRRQRWSWLLVLIFTFVQPIISISNFPGVEFYGSLTITMRVLFIIEGSACITIFVTMLFPASKKWFFGSEIIDNTSNGNFHTGEILEATYRNYFWDIVWFNIYQTPRSRGFQISFVGMLFLVGLIIFGSLSDTSYSFGIKVLTYSIILISIFSGLIALSFAILGAMFLVRQFDIRALQNSKFSVSESGVISETPFKLRGIRWSGIEKIVQSSNYIMYYVTDWVVFVIPKRAFTNIADAERFIEYSRQCLEKSENANSLN